jgi:hypothetical protein
MKHLKMMISLFVMLISASAFADSTQYLYSGADIPVRSTSSPRSGVISTIKAGQTFQVEKWNRFNTRIRLSDGRVGWIDKDFVAYLAPDSDTGFLPRPLSLVSTHDTAYMPKPGEVPSEYRHYTDGSRSEVVSPVAEDDVAGDDINPQEYDKGEEEVAAGADSAFLAKLGVVGWQEATRQRKRAKYLGGGYGSGNTSKGMCAAGAMDTAFKSGLCKVRPTAPDAYHLYTDGVIKKACPKLKALSSLDPYKAPGASIIVYKGYAGKRKHNYGHVEIKIPVTKELKAKMGRQGTNLKVGEFMYCSDFCAPKPTKRSTNSVVAIYSLK